MRISDWSSDVCSSDLGDDRDLVGPVGCLGRFGQRHHVRSAPRDKDGDFGLIHIAFPQRRPGSSYDWPDTGRRPSPGKKIGGYALCAADQSSLAPQHPAGPSTVQPRVPFSITPIRWTVSLAVVSALVTASTSLSVTLTDMPTPQL